MILQSWRWFLVVLNSSNRGSSQRGSSTYTYTQFKNNHNLQTVSNLGGLTIAANFRTMVVILTSRRRSALVLVQGPTSRARVEQSSLASVESVTTAANAANQPRVHRNRPRLRWSCPRAANAVLVLVLTHSRRHQELDLVMAVVQNDRRFMPTTPATSSTRTSCTTNSASPQTTPSITSSPVDAPPGGHPLQPVPIHKYQVRTPAQGRRRGPNTVVKKVLDNLLYCRSWSCVIVVTARGTLLPLQLNARKRTLTWTVDDLKSTC